MYTGVMLLGLFTLCNLHTFKNTFVKKKEKKHLSIAMRKVKRSNCTYGMDLL